MFFVLVFIKKVDIINAQNMVILQINLDLNIYQVHLVLDPKIYQVHQTPLTYLFIFNLNSYNRSLFSSIVDVDLTSR